MTKHNRINEQDWYEEGETLVEFDIPPMGGQPDMGAGGPPMSQPGGPGDPMGGGDQSNQPNQMSMDQEQGDDLSNDPPFPDMPEEEGNESDFEMWKIKYIKESIKGDPRQLNQLLLQVRDHELEPNERRFVEENLDINFLRQNATIFQASQEIRKLIKKDFDRTNPGESVITHITSVLDKYPQVNEVYLKLSGIHGGKGAYHRLFIGALLGAVQVGSGASNEDLIFEETDYSIRLSTRFNSRWGDVAIGRWVLKEDDPERYLKDVEVKRLDGGSPEEKDVLRRRVVMESIAEHFLKRAFIINVVGGDGTVQHLGLDLGNCLKAAFLDGKLVVRTKDDDDRAAFIDEEGSVIPIPKVAIYYIKEGSGLNEKGRPEIEELEFMRLEEGMLFLSAQLDLVKEASVSLQGMVYRETPWTGNPSDIFRVSRCIPSAPEVLLRQC